MNNVQILYYRRGRTYKKEANNKKILPSIEYTECQRKNLDN